MATKLITIVVVNCCMQALCSEKADPLFKLGVENISPAMTQWLSTQRIGLITNQTGRSQQGRATVDMLRDRGVTIKALLVPEHGLQGTVLAERDIHDSIDKRHALPIISLYGNGRGKQLAPDVLNGIDTFVFDIQDSGMRHYTYISTLFYILDAAAHHHKSLVVLDRPNPLGRIVEGPLVDADLKSFIGVAPIPLRHGMTVAELARYFNKNCFENKADLRIVPMIGYQNTQQNIAQCAMNLSPNIQNLQACYGYSFLGLLGEIRPFDLAIGTPLAFQCIMLPHDLNVSSAFWATLRSALAQHAIQSTNFSYYSTRKKKRMVGLRIAIQDIEKVSTCALLGALVRAAHKHGIQLTFSQAFDKAIGSSKARPSFPDPIAWSRFMQSTTDAVKRFCKQAEAAYLYKPLPLCISLIATK